MDSSNIDKIIENSVDRAKVMNHEYCTLEHVTLSLLEHKKIVDLLSSLQIETDRIKSDLDMYLNDIDFNGLETTNGYKGAPKKTGAIERVFQRGLAQVIFGGREKIDPIDLLVSILSEDECISKYYMELNGLTKFVIINHIDSKFKNAKNAELIEEYTKNLNEEAINKNIDPLIGRDDEVNDLVHILARRKKEQRMYCRRTRHR